MSSLQTTHGVLTVPDRQAVRFRWKAPRRAERAGLAAVFPLFVLLLWQIASARQWVSAQVLPAPALVGSTFADLIRAGDIGTNLLISLRRITVGFTIGGLLGFGFGLLMGSSAWARAYFGSLFRAVAAVPSLGWLPILILLLGIDESLKLVILVKACFVPMTISTADAVRNVPPALIEVAHALRLSRRARFFKLTLPAITPMLFSGIRLAAGQAFVSLIIVEMLAGTDGIGYMMVWGRTLFQLDIVIVGMVVVGVTGYLLDRFLCWLEYHIARRSGLHG